MRAPIALVVVLSFVPSAGILFGGDPPPKSPPAAGKPPASDAPAAYDEEKTAAERAADEAGYREHILGWRGFILNEHLGEWVVIAGGKAYPVNEHGTAVKPAPTMEAADAAARAAVPGARHRFVFRVGEEGDLAEELGGAEITHVLGTGFLAKLERDDVEMRGYGPNQPIHFVKGGTRTEITVKGPDHRMFVKPEVGSPGAAGRAEALYVLSTGCNSYAVLPAETAAAASLHLWEIPGKVSIEGAFQKGECRRARARFRFPNTDLDFTLPVAIWPAPPAKPR